MVGPNKKDVPFGSAGEPFSRVGGYHGVANVTIANNTIDTWYRGVALMLGEAANASVRGNTIGPGAPRGEAAVAVADSNGVKIEENVFVGGEWSGLDAAIIVEKTTTSDVTLAANTLKPLQ